MGGRAGVVESVDTPALGAGAARRGGSSPSARTLRPRPGVRQPGTTARGSALARASPTQRPLGDASHGTSAESTAIQDDAAAVIAPIQRRVVGRVSRRTRSGLNPNSDWSML